MFQELKLVGLRKFTAVRWSRERQTARWRSCSCWDFKKEKTAAFWWWGWRGDCFCWDGSVLFCKENDSSSNRTSSSETERRRQLWMARERMLIGLERMGLLWSTQMDKCWQSHAESRLKLADCINGTAGGDRKRKKRRGGRKEGEEGKKELVTSLGAASSTESCWWRWLQRQQQAVGRAAGVARQTARSGRRSDHDDEGGRGRGQTVLMMVAWSIIEREKERRNRCTMRGELNIQGRKMKYIREGEKEMDL